MLSNEFCNVYTAEQSSAMDTNRNCVRRLCPDDIEFSGKSILKAMDNFVKAVSDMDETILIPSRLMDLKISDDNPTGEIKGKQRRLVKELHNTDLYSVYNMINSIKTELVWGQNGSAPYEPDPVNTTITTTNSTQVKGHIRRPSTVSVTSTNSSSSGASITSDTDSETGVETDSGVEAEAEDYTQIVSERFRRHLNGLYHCLDDITQTANYLTARYQKDILM